MIKRLAGFLEPEEADAGPVIEARPLGALAGGKSLPITWSDGVGDLGGGARVERTCHEPFVRAHGKHMRLVPLLKHHAQALVRTIERVGQNIGTGNAGVEGGRDQVTGDLRLGHETLAVRNCGCGATHVVLRPVVRQIQPPIDQRVAEAAGIAEEHADLAVLDAPRRAGILPPDADRVRSLLQKPRFIDDKPPSGSPSASTT